MALKDHDGYMLIEMILASVIAFAIAYFAIDMTIKMKNKNDDLLVETLVATDQALSVNDTMKNIISSYSYDSSNRKLIYPHCPDYPSYASDFKNNNYIDITYNYKGINPSENVSITTEDCFDNPYYTTFINNYHLIVKQLPEKKF